MGLIGIDLLNRLRAVIDVEVPSVHENNNKTDRSFSSNEMEF